MPSNQMGVPMKGTSKHEVVVASELAHACVKLAVVDEPARFADHEKCEDDPEEHQTEL